MVSDSRFQTDQPGLMLYTGSYGGGAPDMVRSYDEKTDVSRSQACTFAVSDLAR